MSSPTVPGIPDGMVMSVSGHPGLKVSLGLAGCDISQSVLDKITAKVSKHTI